jgi:actin-related protein 2
MYIQIQAVLTLYAQGLLEGVVVDSGDGVTHAVPVYEGIVLPPEAGKGGTQRLNAAGRHVTTYLKDLLLIRGYAFNESSDFDLLREVRPLYMISAGVSQNEARGVRWSVPPPPHIVHRRT